MEDRAPDLPDRRWEAGDEVMEIGGETDHDEVGEGPGDLLAGQTRLEQAVVDLIQPVVVEAAD
jgi:hypothetical protein